MELSQIEATKEAGVKSQKAWMLYSQYAPHSASTGDNVAEEHVRAFDSVGVLALYSVCVSSASSSTKWDLRCSHSVSYIFSQQTSMSAEASVNTLTKVLWRLNEILCVKSLWIHVAQKALVPKCPFQDERTKIWYTHTIQYRAVLCLVDSVIFNSLQPHGL